MITPVQVKAARALLNWSQEDLAGRSGVVRRTLMSFETGERLPHVSTLRKIRHALEEAGIEFVSSSHVSGVLLHTEP